MLMSCIRESLNLFEWGWGITIPVIIEISPGLIFSTKLP